MARSETRKRQFAATAVLIAALIACLLALDSAPATAETPEGSTLPTYDASGFPIIQGPVDPEEFSWRVELGPDVTLRQFSETQAQVVYKSGVVAYSITAEPAHDAVGATVPTTLRVSEGDVLTLIVHHRAGNPAAGGASFVYPILDGVGWEGGPYQTVIVKGPPDEAEEFAAREAAVIAANPGAKIEPPPRAPVPTPVAVCAVPALRGLSLRAAKAHLRTADCAIGQVRLARGATPAKGAVVRQSHPAGTTLAAGAPVAVRLGTN